MEREKEELKEKSKEELKEDLIKNYLNTHGVKVRHKGYYYLKEGISACMDQPYDSCKVLFEKVAGQISMKNNRSLTWRTLYQSCDYTLSKLPESRDLTTLSFIKDAAIYVESHLR